MTDLSNADADGLAARVYKASYITGNFTLRSGQQSHEYFDKYLFETEPGLLDEIIRHMLGRFIEYMNNMTGAPQVQAWAGLEMGGIPLVTSISRQTGIPAVFVRKESKGHGTDKVIEGLSVTDKHVVVIEDVVTSGGQIVKSVGDLRKEGADVRYVLCAIDRRPEGATALEDADLTLISGWTMAQLKEAGAPPATGESATA